MGMAFNDPMTLRWLCLLPLASLVAVESYVARFEGWGAWAAAPLLLLPALVSLPLVLWGLFMISGLRRAGESYLATLGWTIVAGLPVLWLGVRRFFF